MDGCPGERFFIVRAFFVDEKSVEYLPPKKDRRTREKALVEEQIFRMVANR